MPGGRSHLCLEGGDEQQQRWKCETRSGGGCFVTKGKTCNGWYVRPADYSNEDNDILSDTMWFCCISQ